MSPWLAGAGVNQPESTLLIKYRLNTDRYRPKNEKKSMIEDLWPEVRQ